ncbi:MAG TPA: MgtC/SapB family protein [Burkholderiaceae bacterium]|nr:MgtC/SapB family protein [Burkholderiaceae bacterium]
MTELDFFLRVIVGTLCGVLIGFERARDRKSTGMRTLGLVGLGGALAVAAFQHAAGGNFDSTARVMQGMLAGIGFLGAGVILHGWRTQRTHGMTTAAAIWLTAILGMVAGIGEIAAAIIGAAIAFALLSLGGHVDRAIGLRLGTHEDDGGDAN